MKYFLMPLLFFTLTSFSQGTSSNRKQGDVYCYHKDTGEFTKINAELWQIQKEGKLKGLQYQLIDLGYDVEVTGCIDKKTIKAFEANKKRLKKQKRLVRREKRV